MCAGLLNPMSWIARIQFLLKLYVEHLFFVFQFQTINHVQQIMDNVGLQQLLLEKLLQKDLSRGNNRGLNKIIKYIEDTPR